MVVMNHIADLKIAESAVALGKFDGVHLGHQAIIKELKKTKEDVKTVVITFSVSPEAVITGKNVQYLMTEQEKQEYFEKLGIDYFLDIRLEKAFLQVEAETFIRAYLVDRLGVKKVVCGKDFRFGRNRRGNVELLRAAGISYGFETAVVEPVAAANLQISSTKIREEIKNGNIQMANRMLGHSYTLSGEVTHGRALGRTVQFPTVNLIPAEEKILPPNGVYASYCSFGLERKKSITNIGKKPTVGGQNLVAETHILDYSGDLYGQKISVELLEYLRPEMKFSSLDELKTQITQDVEKARKCF